MGACSERVRDSPRAVYPWVYRSEKLPSFLEISFAVNNHLTICYLRELSARCGTIAGGSDRES